MKLQFKDLQSNPFTNLTLFPFLSITWFCKRSLFLFLAFVVDGWYLAVVARVLVDVRICPVSVVVLAAVLGLVAIAGGQDCCGGHGGGGVDSPVVCRGSFIWGRHVALGERSALYQFICLPRILSKRSTTRKPSFREPEKRVQNRNKGQLFRFCALCIIFSSLFLAVHD